MIGAQPVASGLGCSLCTSILPSILGALLAVVIIAMPRHAELDLDWRHNADVSRLLTWQPIARTTCATRMVSSTTQMVQF